MIKHPILFILLGCVLSSCINDITTIDATFTRATALYADLDDLRSTTLIGEAREISNPGKIFVSDELLLVGEEKEGIHVIDNSNPENPVARLFINIPGNREFFVDGDYLFAESHYDMLKIDISNVNQPVLMARSMDAFGSDTASPVLTNERGESLVGV